jgi:hypothetical protein
LIAYVELTLITIPRSALREAIIVEKLLFVFDAIRRAFDMA